LRWRHKKIKFVTVISKNSTKMDNKQLRVLYLFHWKLNLTATECLNQIKKAFPECSTSLTTVCRWYKEFESGNLDLEDKPRTGCPPTAVTAINIERMRKLVEEDPRITYEMIEETVGISAPSIHTILHDHLQMSKICARWVPHFLTNENKKARVEFCLRMLQLFSDGESRNVGNILTGDETWVYAYEPLRKQQDAQWVRKGDPRPTKIQKQRSTKKQMVAAFFTRSGLVKLVRLETGEKANANWYTTVCLPEVFCRDGKKAPKYGIKGNLFTS